MRTTAIVNYTFNKEAKTVTFTDFTTLDITRILNIVDVTNNQSIFCSKLPSYGGTVATNILTLNLNTNNDQFNNSDDLLIEMINENEELTIAVSATRTSTLTTGEIVNYNHKGVTLFINVTAIVDTPTLAVKIQVKDPVSGTWTDLPSAVTASIVAAGVTLLTVYPGLTISTNAKIDYLLPRTFRVVGTFGSTTSITYSIGAIFHN